MGAIDCRDLMNFYKDHFSLDALKRLITAENISTREFAFKYTDATDSVGRPVCFGSVEEFAEYLGIWGPNKTYIGGFYARRFPEDKASQAKIRASEWVGRELVFDIDMDHYMTVRKDLCECGEQKRICDRCLELAKEAVLFTVDTLEEDFGMTRKDIVVIFSGRQGFHIWVPSVTKMFKNERSFPPTIATRVEVEMRTALAEYLQLIAEKQRKRRIEGELVSEHTKAINYDALPAPLRNRVLNHTFKNLALKSPDSVLKEFSTIKFDKWQRVKTLLLNGATGVEAWGELVGSSSAIKERRLFEKVIDLRYPRFDVGCTKDIHRIMKVPGSVDGSTGNLCVIVDDILSFSLDKVPNIYDFVEKNG